MDYQFDFEDVSLNADGLVVGGGFSGTAHVSGDGIDQIVLTTESGKFLTLYPRAKQHTDCFGLLGMELFHALVPSLLKTLAYQDARDDAYSTCRDANAEHKLLQSELI